MTPSATMRVREASATELANWDAIVRRFPNYRLPHTRAWIDTLASCNCGKPLYRLLEDETGIVGCFPGLLVTVGRWKLFGSPLAGWQTVSLGPAYDPARFDTGAFASSVVSYLEREHDVDHIEMLHLGLDPEGMRAAGFEDEPVFTFRAPLYPNDEARTFKQLKMSARRNVKRAQRLGLITKFEDDESFVDEHYAQLKEVYRRGGFAVPFGKQRVLEFFRKLKQSGNLIAISVYLPGGRVNIATGIFYVEGTELLLWMWAHRQHYRWYRPTELMTWTVMQRAIELGCTTFDFMGGGEFKIKFGAEPDRRKVRWLRGRRPWLMKARRVAKRVYGWQQSLRGRASLVTRQATGFIGRAGRPAHPTRPPAVVLGDIDLVRALGCARIPSTVLAPPGAPVRYSRHTRAVFPWHNAWDSQEPLVESLVRFGQAQPEPPCLFYQEDRTLLMVSRHRERLREAFRFVVPDAELVEQLVDKSRFQALAAKLDLPVPAARVINPGDPEPGDDFPIPFPLILKPLVRIPARWEPIASAGKAISVQSMRELRELWPRIMAANLALLAQELIPGAETSIESYHAYVDERGAIAGEFAGKKIRTLPPAYGDSTALETSDAQDVLALGRALVKRLQFRGVAKFDFKRDLDGRLRLLEVNPRFNLWHHLGAVAGVNLPALVYGDLIGAPRPMMVPARAGYRWCKPWKDLSAARASGMSFAQWVPWVIQCEAKSGFAWDDPLPLIGATLRRGIETLGHTVRRTKEPPLTLRSAKE
ncbi:MAG TPA: GNAT family N-acetyltransferase [Gemmatimonadales bacterium]|nr:GNAT family N-acetyltransferase [Gemmatimonadales bacterium]